VIPRVARHTLRVWDGLAALPADLVIAITIEGAYATGVRGSRQHSRPVYTYTHYSLSKLVEGEMGFSIELRSDHFAKVLAGVLLRQVGHDSQGRVCNC